MINEIRKKRLNKTYIEKDLTDNKLLNKNHIIKTTRTIINIQQTTDSYTIRLITGGSLCPPINSSKDGESKICTGRAEPAAKIVSGTNVLPTAI